MTNKNILVTGGLGFVGSKLVPNLLSRGFFVTVIDVGWFGNFIDHHSNLTLIKDDIRNIKNIELGTFDTVIHLANIANDPAVDLNPTLSWEVNVLAGYQLIDKLVTVSCPHFIFASSGSVYGIKTEKEVTEELELVPISTYNKTKMIAERVFLSFSDRIRVHCVRPATVCGWSPRMRLDVAVNLLTMQALENNEITVLGGQQTRPNIHIDDMVNVYTHLIDNEDIMSGCYNAGFENLKIQEIAEIISKKLNVKINVKESNDPRSYNQNSDKLLATGFKQEYTVEDAVDEIIKRYRDGELVNNEKWHTVSRMKALGVA